MKIALIGIRGIPVIYSGFEVAAEKLSTELVKRGHKLTVYCRNNYVDSKKKKYKEVRLIVLPSPKSKNWETFIHSLLSTFHAILFGHCDLIYYFGVGNSLFSLLPRLFGTKTVVNVDGLDWKREKWGIVGRLYLGLSEYLASFLPNRIITDSLFIKKYYKKRFNKESKYVPYGFYKEKRNNKLTLKGFGLKNREYVVWVGRFVPDNHPDELIDAFSKLDTLDTKVKCVIVGDDISESIYKKRLLQKGKKDVRIIFTGFLDRVSYASVVRGALAYVETKRSGGTHPSLVEAMGFGSLVISNDHFANKEVLGDTAIYYKTSSITDLTKRLDWVVDKKNYRKQNLLREKCKERSRQRYSWEKIVDDYEKFFIEITQSY